MTDIRKLAEAATPGPWCVKSKWDVWCGDDDCPNAPLTHPNTDYRRWGREISMDEHIANARFIAAANPTAVLALLDEIDTLRAKVKSQAEALKPFVRELKDWDFTTDDDNRELSIGFFGKPEAFCTFTIGDLRRAAQETSDET